METDPFHEVSEGGSQKSALNGYRFREAGTPNKAAILTRRVFAIVADYLCALVLLSLRMNGDEGFLGLLLVESMGKLRHCPVPTSSKTFCGVPRIVTTVSH
jgi:hypothetical protein